MLRGLTSAFKNNCNNVELTYKEYVVLDNQTIEIKATLSDDTYENGNFIGTFIFKQIMFETDATYNFKNKEFDYYKVVDGESIKIGTFISTDITINDTTEIVKVIGMDYGLKTQIEYTSHLDYENDTITLKDVWDECCSLSGLESGISDFPNSDFIVDSDQFSRTGATIRDVFKGIAMSCGSFVKVMNDNKIYLIFNEMTSDEEEIEIDGGISIENSYKLNELELKGKSTQSGTPAPSSPIPIDVITGRQVVSVAGKNLLNNNTFVKGRLDSGNIGYEAGTTDLQTTDNSISFTTNTIYRGVASAFIPVSQNTDYTFTCQVPSNTSFYVDYYKENQTWISRTSATINGNVSQTITTVANAGFIRISFQLASAGTITMSNLMLEKGNQATTYEAYQGNSYEINLGKNLFDVSTSQDYKWLNGTTGKLDNSTDTNIVSDFIHVNIGETYVLNVSTDLYVQLWSYASPSSTTGTTKLISYSKTTRTFQPDTSYIRFAVGGGDAITPKNTYQLEKGTQATSYAEYFTPIELCKIGDVQDRIYKQDGKWYLYKTIDKFIPTGNETWNYDTSKNYARMGGGIFNSAVIQNEIQMNTHFQYRASSWANFRDATTTNSTYMLSSVSDSNYQLCIRNTALTSKDDYVNWVKANQPVFYYQMATPTTEEITNQELINQLESIKLLKELNNIYTTVPSKISYYNNEFDIIEDYVELEDKRDTHPWTCLRLGVSNIEGENVDYIDEDLVEQYGENWLILNDNPFAYNQEKREQLIENIFNQIKEFGYSAFVSKISFKPYLTCGDIINFKNRNGQLVNSIVLRYNHNYEQITIEAPSETSATVNYVYPLEAIDIAKRTQIIVDKDSVRIDSLTSQTQTITDDLRDNYYTLEETNELVQTAQTGLTNTFSEAGGNNIFRNTGLWFSTNDNNNPYEFWNGIVVKQKEDKASNLSALLLQNNELSQEQIVPNGTYTISFKYKKLIELAEVSVKINDTEYELSSTNEEEFMQVIQVSSQHINITFISDIANACEVYDLMVNAGGVKLAYSQNQNETTTDTVNISKGITITSTDTDTTFKANADGIRTLDNGGNVLTEFTDTGMIAKKVVVQEESQIVNVLWQEVGSQTWLTRL